MPPPHFEYEAENRILGTDALEEDDMHDKYIKDFNEIKSLILEPATDHPDYKWVMLWEGFKSFLDYRRRSNYCNPDSFGMYIYNDFNGWGLQELMENQLVAFDATLKKKDDDALKRTWAAVTALGLWLNEVDMGPFVANEDGEKVQALVGLMGFALLRALAALDHAEELKADTEFLDVPIVITGFLEWSSDLPAYGIDGEAVEWRPHAAGYFKQAKFKYSKGIAGTEKLIEEAEPSDETKLAKKTDKDPWKWTRRLKDYKSLHGPKIGGTKYDITKMSRKERAKHAFDNKDPLADISEKDLKEGNLDLA
ncbi:hypothetical protein CC86DRAFT_367670 [Ophiobolus disseminans]|uniref:SAP domain-containing protein n=1 Tax=Ophiobolus disseminans TaxID=1469910 RepID=A0A6A7AAL9_9PLEO|nr:hypothetical protein CC86DRAFT_367670 [Ophiobolus disseminans]